jgi:hypothetical protein
VVDATGTTNQLRIGGSVINSGLLEATGPAGLGLFSSINNTGGIISAGANSTVYLYGGAILGGTLSGSGDFVVPDGSTETLQSTINDLGTITLQSTGDPTMLVMNIWYKPSGTSYTLINPTLTGGGNIVLSGPNSQIIGPGINRWTVLIPQTGV